MIERNNPEAIILVLATLAALWGAIRLVVGRAPPALTYRRQPRTHLGGPDVGAGDDGAHHGGWGDHAGDGGGHGGDGGGDGGH